MGHSARYNPPQIDDLITLRNQAEQDAWIKVACSALMSGVSIDWAIYNADEIIKALRDRKE